jgi:aspartyl-tRNA synthetase
MLDDEGYTRSFDLLFKGLEIITGAQREHRYDVLEKQATEKGLVFSEMKAYNEIFRYGMPPHGGFGAGIDRIVKQMLDLDDVREAILLPRDPERIYP